MTTEIAILNKSAIALAADSAVTIKTMSEGGQSHKVLNSANKLFQLSKYQPVGLMVYGNAALLGIPWETIVKMYRESLGIESFKSLEEYCTHFFAYLDAFEFENSSQEQYLVDTSGGLCFKIKQELDKCVEEKISNGEEVTESKAIAVLEKLVEQEYKEFVELGKESVFNSSKKNAIRRKYRSLFEEVQKEIFGKLPLTTKIKSQLSTIAINAASVGPTNQSGIVIAGFGQSDVYPQYHSFDVSAVLEGKTIKRDGGNNEVSHSNGAIIVPFAQSDEVHTFMQGIGPILNDFLLNTFYGIMTQFLPESLRDEIGNKLKLTNKQKKEIESITEQMCKGACDYAFKKFREQQQKNYVEPIVEATGFLDKAELATMAETLVNLVSFKKQVTMETETVGGPIDVAVITKGNGFIWIKRKHYFNPDLNHHFFANYHRENCYS